VPCLKTKSWAVVIGQGYTGWVPEPLSPFYWWVAYAAYDQLLIRVLGPALGAIAPVGWTQAVEGGVVRVIDVGEAVIAPDGIVPVLDDAGVTVAYQGPHLGGQVPLEGQQPGALSDIESEMPTYHGLSQSGPASGVLHTRGDLHDAVAAVVGDQCWPYLPIVHRGVGLPKVALYPGDGLEDYRGDIGAGGNAGTIGAWPRLQGGQSEIGYVGEQGVKSGQLQRLQVLVGPIGRLIGVKLEGPVGAPCPRAQMVGAGPSRLG